jgi:hypothetical protein
MLAQSRRDKSDLNFQDQSKNLHKSSKPKEYFSFIKPLAYASVITLLFL